ncbi:MAG: AI-2E family transporter [Patescibacteria group bacterium]
MEKEQVLDISWETIIKIFIAIFILYFIYLAREIALWFFFGLSISILLEPAINFLRKIRIPKLIAIFIIYLSIFGVLGILIYLTAPLFIFELKQFSQSLPSYLEQINPALKQVGFDMSQGFEDLTSLLTGSLVQSSKSVLKAIMIFFGGVSSTAFILTISFFLSLEERGAEKFLILITPKKYEDNIIALFERAQSRVAGWFGARVLSCLFVAVASFIVFYIFGVKYAFLLALISGIMNFIPYIGPWITSVLLAVFILVSSSSWLTLLYVLIAIILVQEVDNKLLTPILMKKMIALPPVLVLVSLLLGAKIFGFLGTIFAVPVFGIIYEFVKEFLEKKREEASQSY